MTLLANWTLTRQNLHLVRVQFTTSDPDFAATIFLDGAAALENALQDGSTRLVDVRWGGSAVHHVEAHEHDEGAEILSTTATIDSLPTIGWPRVADAYIYRVYVDGIRRGYIEQDADLPWYGWILTAPALPGGWHEIAVTATDSSGNESVKQRQEFFVFTPLPMTSALAISGPIGGPFTLTITP